MTQRIHHDDNDTDDTPVLTNEAVDWLEDDEIDLRQAAVLASLGRSR